MPTWAVAMIAPALCEKDSDMPASPPTRLRLALATEHDLPNIHRLRHAVYATELGQYDIRDDGELPDRDDLQCQYVVATVGSELVGFVAITPPSSPTYSVDRYLPRTDVPHPFDDTLYEIRALTVRDGSRGRTVAPSLMYAAFRHVQSCGGTRILAIGRTSVLDMYLRLGMEREGVRFTTSGVEYELISATVADVTTRLQTFARRVDQLENHVDWQLPIAFHAPASCYHGGAFFDAIGDRFDRLDRVDDVIAADVLDAWFPPAPAAVAAMREGVEWQMRTSPPTHACGLVETIATTRGVRPEQILVGAGSSTLIFLALREWLTPASRVLVLDPTYGEYLHVLEHVVGCHIDRMVLNPSHDYDVDSSALLRRLTDGAYDMFVWVNPNSPTGRHVPRDLVEAVVAKAPIRTRIWIDETYVDYVGPDQSLEQVTATRPNLVVCKSMSKMYALSGMRVAYLCGAPATLESLRGLVPPWPVSLPAQIAAVRALESQDYYEACWDETHALREELADGLRALGITSIVPGVANFLLVHLPQPVGTAATLVARCRMDGVYLRDAAGMGTKLGPQALRIAVKDSATNRRMLATIAQHVQVAAPTGAAV